MSKSIELEFKNILKNIPDSYEDFIRGISQDCDTDEKRNKIIKFIENDENLTTSKIIEYVDDEILGIPKI